MYSQGEGVRKDKVEAFKWYRMSAEQRHPGSQYVVGVMYANGDGVPKDFVQAHVWFNLASARGHKEAKVLLNSLEKDMTSEQKAEAMKMAREMFEKISAKK
jgi:hypothetical protein